ncbi:TolC family protein [Alteromonas sp. 5E99-2]|uniref:TolC family protein n=1 Tax=Alteromonas sp. 5E99-2 TaxID=2817683 RepID=UPI001A98BA7F|nr:TolC family protein [Alteromonas sp. 5E99-2]MBO1256678.1 TolC family protein [Alteromonas sp. 5E99-2]
MENIQPYQCIKLILAPLIIAIAGCTNTGSFDNFEVQLNELAKRAENELSTNERVLSESSGEVFHLNDLIQIPVLDSYINLALENNPNLQQSLQSLRAAYYQTNIIRSQRLPIADLSVSGSRIENTQSTEYSTEVSVSWELDFWNKLNDEKNAALLDLASQEQNVDQTKNVLVTSIMRAWLNIVLQKELINVEQHRLSNQMQNLELIESRYSSGLDNLESLDNARANVFQIQSELVARQQQRYAAEQAFSLLVGHFNSEITFDEKDLVFPNVLFPTHAISIKTLSKRPDLKASFLGIKAEAFRTDATYKAMFPSFSLTAILSDSDTSPIESLLTDPIWQLLGQISAPVFQGGRLRNQFNIAEVTLAQQVYSYQEALLKAVSEVELALSIEFNSKQRQHYLQNALSSAASSYTSFREKYQEGLADIFDLLTTQQQMFDLQSQLIQIKYERLINRIDLGLALGLGATQ